MLTMPSSFDDDYYNEFDHQNHGDSVDTDNVLEAVNLWCRDRVRGVMKNLVNATSHTR